MTDSQSLFSPSLISASVLDGLPDGFTIRPLARDDYHKGFYECLRVLTWVADPTEAEFLGQFNEMVAAKDTYFFAVVEFRDRIVGTGCLVAEKKFIHNHGKCGHVEEIAGGSSLPSSSFFLSLLVSTSEALNAYTRVQSGEENADIDVEVVKEHQGKGLGLKIMRALESVAVAVGCYKNILNCGPRNEPFYEKCGYHNSGIEMSNYLEEERDSYHRG